METLIEKTNFATYRVLCALFYDHLREVVLVLEGFDLIILGNEAFYLT